jgi:hypothetical protein
MKFESVEENKLNERVSPIIIKGKFIDDFITYYSKIVNKNKFEQFADNMSKLSKNWNEVAELLISGDYDYNDIVKYLDDDDIRSGSRMIYQFNQDLFLKKINKPSKWNESVYTDEVSYLTFKSFINKASKLGFF